MLAVWLSPVYILVNVYFIWRILKWLHICHGAFGSRRFRIGFCILYAFLAFTPLTSYLFKDGMVHRILKILNNYWFGILLYMGMTIFLADGILFILKKSRRKRAQWIKSRNGFRIYGGICMVLITAVSAYGMFHPRIIKNNQYEIPIEKECKSRKALTVVLIADLHVGYSIDELHVKQMVRKINRQNPDLVLFAGDFYDNDFKAIGNPEKVARYVQQIKSRYGVYGCWGNHDVKEDILAGFTFPQEEGLIDDPRMREFMEKDCGIELLEDEVAWIGNDFYLVGRKDPSRSEKLLETRKTAEELLEGLDHNNPIIVMDHQPKEYEELEKAGADLTVGGHTHNGQLFPLNLLMKRIWENPSGYKKIQKMHTVVTSGVGVWGPAMRVGTDSEIVTIIVSFE